MKNIIACLLLVLLTGNAVAKDRDHHEDQDRAREAVERGDASSYAQLEEVITSQFKGRIIRVELDREWHEWVYKLRLLEDDGRVVKIEVNAKNLQIVEVEGRQLESIVKLP